MTELQERVARFSAPQEKIDPTSNQWMSLIPDEQWFVYRDAIEQARKTGLRFMLGGGFALASYIGRWRNTKDIDFYVLPNQRQPFVDALADAGFSDYFEQRPYDRQWIYRSFRDGTIVDLIWSMANRRAEVQPWWFDQSRELIVRGESLRVIAPEELLWCKMYVLQRDHSDWPDILNLLHAVGADLDWNRILENVREDWPVLKSILTLFSWVSPSEAAELPHSVRQRFNLPPAGGGAQSDEERRVRLLDSRQWFAARLPSDRVLEV